MKKSNIVTLANARIALGCVVGISTYAVTKAVIKNNVDDPETLAQKATLGIGCMALGSIVSGATTNYVDGRLMDLVNEWRDQNSKNDTSTDTQS